MSLKVAIDKFPFSGQFSSNEHGVQADAIERGGLDALLSEWGCTIAERYTAGLSGAEERAYGSQHRMALAGRHLATAISRQLDQGMLPLALHQNCNGLMGSLAGVQGSGGRVQRVGLVWIDAHGDFNTPETSLSGMLGGMPVAISCGLCLERLRRTCGLDPALPTRYVTMVAARDIDPLERDLLDRSDVHHITTEEVKKLAPSVWGQMKRLAALTDKIYVHVDMDVLDPSDIPGAGLPVADGPTAAELGAALEVMFRHPKACCFGVASYPAARDPDRVGLRSVYRLIEGVVRGVKSRA